MALTPPDPNEDFLPFLNLEEWPSDEAERYAPVVLQQGTDVFMVATRLTSDPSDPADARIMDMGIMAMAQALAVQQPDRAREYSKFSSERLGSYSYQKAANQAAKGEGTGVDLFDWSVRWFLQGGSAGVAAGGVISLQAEEVFLTPYPLYREQYQTILREAAWGWEVNPDSLNPPVP